jgi:hypothetical protein
LPIDHNPDPDLTSEYKNETNRNEIKFFENTKYLFKNRNQFNCCCCDGKIKALASFDPFSQR